jgi:glycosyltransferase involved in cell wall biosynthesis
MKCPTLAELPPPPAGRRGWPWTEESPPIEPHGDAAWPRISVVVPSYQQGRFLEETLRSVLLQGYPDLELIVMDGGSTDESVTILEKYARWIASWVSERDGGQSAAINNGWRRSSGAFVSWLNSDDLVMPGWLARTVPVMCANTELDCAYNDTQVIDGDSRPQWLYKASTPNLEDMMVYWRMPFAQQGYLMRRQVLASSGYLREDLHFAMDVEYVVRLLVDGRKFVHIKGVNGAFRMHDAGKTATQHGVHVADMIDLATKFCQTTRPDLAGLVGRARERLYWSAAHAKYDGRHYAEARVFALRHLREAGWRVLPRVSGMVALSFLGDPGRQILSIFRRIRNAPHSVMADPSHDVVQ